MTYLMVFMRCFFFVCVCVCVCVCFLVFFIRACVLGAHIKLHRQCNSNGYPYIFPNKEVEEAYTGCNLKNMSLRDCAIIGVCAVIRSNTVFVHDYFNPGPAEPGYTSPLQIV